MTQPYETELSRIVAQRYGALPPEAIVARLFEMGVVDHTRCKKLCVRLCVEELLEAGMGKVKAMWLAAERFCVTYEYVRNVVYYHKEINLAN